MDASADPNAAPRADDSLAPVESLPTTVILPNRGFLGAELVELWAYRELLGFFVWRDIKVRYKQTALGALWAILQPLLTMVVFSLFFGKLASMPSDGVPYPIFSFAALVPWTFFANALAASSNSLVGSANLLRKIYFPRLIIPLGAVFAGVVDFFLAFLVLLGMMAAYGIMPTANIVWLPFLLILSVAAALAVGLWLSALNVEYRDVRHTVPFLVQLWLFATPIAYPSSLLAEKWRIIYALNPMVGVVDGFRWALLDTETMPGPTLLASSSATLVLLVAGLLYFRRMERTFADVV